MRDLDSELTGLRNALQDSIGQPATEDMIKRGRRRVRRQQAQVAAVVATIVVAGVWPFLNATPQATAPAARPDQSHVLAQDHFDKRSGFALGRVCKAEHCDPWFLSTSNGETWVKRDVPPIEVSDTSYPDRVIALGSSRVVIEDYRGNWADRYRYYSGNGGQTWSAVSIRPDTTIQQIPQDAALETKAPGTDQCRDGAVIAVLSESGHSAKLANQPPIELTWCGPYPDPNGTRWVGGSDPRTRQPVVASTRDRGLTWQVTPLPHFTAPTVDKITSYYPKVTVVSTPTASYATVTNPGNVELVAIFRSADHGVSWTQTWQASEGRQPARILGTPVAGTDGNIRIIQDSRDTPDNVWVSTDGARTFTVETGRSIPTSGGVYGLRAGYVSSSPDSGSTGQFSLSGDGINWHPVHIPIPE